MKALLLAALLVGATQAANAKWVFNRTIFSEDTKVRDEMFSALWSFDILRSSLEASNLVSPGKLVAFRIFGQMDEYLWDGECDRFKKGEIAWKESSGANYYFTDKPNEYWQTQVGVAFGGCRSSNAEKYGRPQIRTRRL